MKRLSGWTAALLALLIIAQPLAVIAAEPLADYASTLELYTVNPDIPAYAAYQAAHGSARASTSVQIDAAAFIRYTEGGSETTPDILDNFNGMSGASVRTGENAVVEYTVTISEEGWYQPQIDYYPIPGKSASIQRALFIDGALPCRELALVEFPRIWANTARRNTQGDFLWEKDNQGNDLKPVLAEQPEWVSSAFHDADGYIPSPLAVYLTAGEHTVSLVSIREPMLIRRITFNPMDASPPAMYEQAKAAWDQAGATDASGVLIAIDAESAVRTSSQMLYPTQELGSPAVSPSSANTLLNNTIGGSSWRLSGQWIEWEFSAPQSGYYHIGMSVNQNLKRGIYVSRKIMIDGKPPFAELGDYGFTFSQSWRQLTLSSPDGNPYRVYLEAGRHTLRMEAALGGFAGIVGQVRDAVYELNSIYRNVIRLTGVAPDRFRDYQIESSLPSLTAQLTAVRDNLANVIDSLRQVAGKRSDRERALVSMRDQLTVLISDNEKFGQQINSFKVNVRACGTWLNEAMLQPLQLDAIQIYSPDITIGVDNASFLTQAAFEVKRLFYSFIINYNAIGNVSDDPRSITLWIGSGRDQANVIKALIDETFTRDTGVSVNVMLVDMSTLLQATLAGQGPDAAIQVGWDLPMNYGLRGAALDLSQFPDLDNVKQRFASSAMTPYEFGGSTYALPETQVYPMMFYRKDILAEMGIKLPNTWADVNVTLAALARSQMEIGMIPSESLFTTLLYQNGGQYYNADATHSALNSEEAIQAFRQYTEFYTDYKLDRVTSAEERFRTGECPIILADYTVYNNLQVSAPDLRGLWGMAPVPGTVKYDGSIDRSVGSYGGACLIMNGTQRPDECWEFLKWWTSTQAQVSYGREMESLMGSSARVPTANLEAFAMMPWPVGDLSSLNIQRASAKGIPQVPGGYFTYRNVNNAFYAVTTPLRDQASGSQVQATPREALADKVILINDEIRYKRIEFGLPVE